MSTESPASVTFSFVIDGYGALFTMRDDEVKSLILKVDTLLELAKKRGWAPQWKDQQLKPMVPKVEPTPVSQPVVNNSTNVVMCPMHPTRELKHRDFSQKLYHSFKNKDGEWMKCFGEGFIKD